MEMDSTTGDATTDDTNVSHALDTRPILGEVARQWQRIHPRDLTMSEALTLLGVLLEITERLDTDA